MENARVLGFNKDLGFEYVERLVSDCQDLVQWSTSDNADHAITDLNNIGQKADALLAIVESDNSDIANEIRFLRHTVGTAMIAVRNKKR